MQISREIVISLIALAPLMVYGQAGTPASPAAPVAPSSLLQPALSSVESTLGALKIDKWKKGTVRDEAGDNVNAILRDVKTNMPPLMADADSAPGALSKSIPLAKHVDALYDVLLRVEEGARVSAPGDQVDQLEAVLKQLGSARNGLYDSMSAQAAGQEKQVGDLQATIKAQKAQAEEHKPAPAPVPCTPPKPAPKKRRATPAKSAPPVQTPAKPTTPAQPPKTQ